MENLSFFLAKFWGWYLIIFFLLLSFQPKKSLQIITYLKDEKFLLIVAFIAILIGLLNTLFHSIWALDWRILISIIGLLALVKGLFLFLFPKKAIYWITLVNIKFVQIFYILLFFLGLFLLNMGYGFVIF